MTCTLGARDQGIICGHASDEPEDTNPLTHPMATRLEKTLTDERKSSELGWLRPEGMMQVAIEYLYMADAPLSQRRSTQGSFPLARRAIQDFPKERACWIPWA
jgi:S-adenosylmethionine synthetase